MSPSFLITRKISPLASSSANILCKTLSARAPFILNMSTTKTEEKGPIQLSIEKKITEALNPTFLKTVNESHLHRHHEPMQGVTSKETHFKVTVVSDEFKGKTLMQRHRMVYGILKKELNEDGVHALGIKAATSVDELN